MIEVKELTKTFRVTQKEPGLRGSLKALFRREYIEKPALRGVSLQVGRGEIVGLVGPNGAGKTTLVKALAGIIHPTSGQAQVLGFIPWQRDNLFRRQIALIMGQKAQLWWDLPAADCFLLLREIYEIPQAEFDKTSGRLCEALGVSGLLKTPIRRLSLGERMKMELVAALLHQPKVVFLDEPTIGLDFASQRAIREFILEYRKLHQPAMIITSHYMEDIKRLCERMVLIREGSFIYDGSFKKFVDEYAQNKIISARFDVERLQEVADAAAIEAILGGHGEIVDLNHETIRVKVLKAKTADVTALLMQRFPVADLNVDEEDISSVIESVMQEQSNA